MLTIVFSTVALVLEPHEDVLVMMMMMMMMMRFFTQEFNWNQ